MVDSGSGGRIFSVHVYIVITSVPHVKKINIMIEKSIAQESS
ncbi:hypothetical protein HMPREF0860_2661 [Treponema socranskii subsp. socranskii VPI DR56BR1116 = ATCC 35536]|uniref:Uncharacterized protein n=1 Tax=Treponema socranskii subsp. socranskii VPI DR56BR1116 = ATCC 35536 TaxID=1125725 RepID=A0ABP2YPE6_TRESO|nr:hypothetical protein HMPREF0860_2661 [Treponema socranskii subsp. socranskii VPI DR56BR1116 = ATCC 35536]